MIHHNLIIDLILLDKESLLQLDFLNSDYW